MSPTRVGSRHGAGPKWIRRARRPDAYLCTRSEKCCYLPSVLVVAGIEIEATTKVSVRNMWVRKID